MQFNDITGPLFTSLSAPYISPALNPPGMEQTTMFGGDIPAVSFGKAPAIHFGDATAFRFGEATPVQFGAAATVDFGAAAAAASGPGPACSGQAAAAVRSTARGTGPRVSTTAPSTHIDVRA